MKFTEKFLIGLLVVSISSTVFLFFRGSPELPTQETLSSELQSVGQEAPPLYYQKKILDIEAENKRLLQKVAELQSLLVQNNTTQKTKETEVVVPDNAPEETKEQFDFHSVKEKQLGNTDRYIGKTAEEIENVRTLRFDKEPIDEEWSLQYGKKLETIIQTNENLSQYAIQELQCRSERCRISVYVGAPENAQSFSEHLVRELVKSHTEPGSYSGVFNDYSKEDGIATFYIGKNAEVQLF